MNIGLFVQARLNSSRLKNKMLLPLYGDKSIIYLSLQAAVENMPSCTERVLLVPYSETYYFKNIAEEFEFDIVEGPEDDVLGRFINGITAYPNLDVVQRVCADKVVFSKYYQSLALTNSRTCLSDLTHYNEDPIRSVTAGVYRVQSLYAAHMFYPWNMDVHRKNREHIKPLFFKGGAFWNVNTLKMDGYFKDKEMDLSIDTEEDLKRMRNLFSDLYTGKPLDFHNVLEWFAENK
jgi:spore coat polysaccharide biosynthesis protein SpsF